MGFFGWGEDWGSAWVCNLIIQKEFISAEKAHDPLCLQVQRGCARISEPLRASLSYLCSHDIRSETGIWVQGACLRWWWQWGDFRRHCECVRTWNGERTVPEPLPPWPPGLGSPSCPVWDPKGCVGLSPASTHQEVRTLGYLPTHSHSSLLRGHSWHANSPALPAWPKVKGHLHTEAQDAGQEWRTIVR